MPLSAPLNGVEGIFAAVRGSAATSISSMEADAQLVGIYRARHATLVRDLVRPALASGWAVSWWALDAVVDDLAEITVGSGQGAKLPLLNEVLRRSGREAEWLVVCDDDIAFERGDAPTLVSLCDRARLDLAQPARADHVVDHEITVARRLSLARRTSFVEIGPVFVVGPSWRDRIVPFPEERGMGWGLELEWHGLHDRGCALGIVDAVRVRHQGETGEDYDLRAHAQEVHAELAERGFAGWSDVQRTLATWRPWQRAPRWLQTTVSR